MWKYIIGNNPTPSKSGYEFKMLNSFEKRRMESTRLKEKFPDKIPIILEKADTSQLPSVDKQKYLMQREITIGQFLYIIRQKINIDHSESIFLLVNNVTIPPTGAPIGAIYDKFGDNDGFLYITYSSQQTFGL